MSSTEKPVHVPRDRYPEAMYPQVIAPSRDEYPTDEIHLLDYWQVIVARRWTILAVLFTVVATTLIYTLKQTPIYKATVTIQIDRENPNILAFKDVYAIESSADDSLRTQFEVLKSRSLARRVIEDLKLDQHEEFKFQSQAPGFLDSFVSSIRDLIVPKVSDAKEGDRLRPVVNSYLGRLEVSPVPQARIVNVSFESKDPELATRVINAHARHFNEQNLMFKFDAANEASSFLEQNLVTLQSKLEKSEDRLQEYSRQNQILFTEGGRNTATEKLQQIEQEYTKAQADRFQKESYDRLIRTGNTDALTQLVNNQLITELTSKLVDLQRQESETAATFGPGYPLLKRLRDQIANLQKSLEIEKSLVVRTVQSEYSAAVAREQLLTDEVKKQRDAVNKINQEIIQYNILKRQVESDRQLYDGLLTRLKEAGVSAGLKASNIRVVDRAEVPSSPVKPRKTLNLLLGIVVGLMLGLGLAVTQEHLDNSLKAPEDVNRYLHLATLGMIPKLESLVGKKGYGKIYGYLPSPYGDTLPPEKRVTVDRIAHEAPLSLMAEAYRSVRTSLLLSSPGHPPRTILVTSAVPSEGKTVTAVNIAISLTQTGSRVILIDSDMRKPRVHRMFSLENTLGLSTFLAGGSQLRDVIHETDIPGLLVIPCGVTPPNPGEMIVSNQFRQMIHALQEHVDYVVLDSPPVSNVSDSRIIASIADTSILVVKAFSTPRNQVRHAVQHLLDAHARLAGVVLNDVDVRLRSYSGSSYYRTYYQSYGNSGPQSEA